MATKHENEGNTDKQSKSQTNKGPSDAKGDQKKGKENVPPPLTKKPAQKRSADQNKGVKDKKLEQNSVMSAWDPNATSAIVMPPPSGFKIPKKSAAPAAAGSPAQLVSSNSQPMSVSPSSQSVISVNPNVQNVDITAEYDPVPQYLQQQAMMTPPQQQQPVMVAQNVTPQNLMGFMPQQQWVSPTQTMPMQVQSPMPYIVPILMDANQMKVMQQGNVQQQQPVQPMGQPAAVIEQPGSDIEIEPEEPVLDVIQDLEEEMIDNMIRDAEPQLLPSSEPPLLPLEPQLEDQPEQPGPSQPILASGDEEEDAWLVQEVEVPEEEVGPPVTESIRQCFDQLWDQGISNAEHLNIKDTYATIYRPSNVESLIKTSINDEISDNLPRGVQRRDSLPKAVQNSLVKGTLGLMDLVSNLPPLKPEERKDILTRTLKIIRCLSYGNSKINLLRRLQFKPYLGPSLKKLVIKPKKPSHQWLYGTDILDEVRDQEAARKMSKVIKKRSVASRNQNYQVQYRPRLQTSYQRFQPYQTQYRPRFGEYQNLNYGFQMCFSSNLVKFVPRLNVVSHMQLARVECRNDLAQHDQTKELENCNTIDSVHCYQDSIFRSPRWTAAAAQTTGTQSSNSQSQEELEPLVSVQPDPEQVSDYMAKFPIKFTDFVAGGGGVPKIGHMAEIYVRPRNPGYC